MNKFFKMLVITLLAVLSLQQIAFAGERTEQAPRPTTGIESHDPKHGSSQDNSNSSIQSISSLFYNYYCSLTNTGATLYLEGTTTSNYLSDQVGLTLYLQKWDGSQWVDVQSWPYTRYNARSIVDGANASYEHGSYYRTRAVHYVTYGSQSETQYSTSSYIWVD